MSDIAVIVVAAGRSRRMQGGPNKVFLKLVDAPVLSYCLGTFEACDLISRVVLVASERDKRGAEEFLAEHHFSKTGNHVVLGGEERHDSVWNGLVALQDSPPDIVLVHDGARPFVSEDMIRDSVQALENADGAIVAVPATDTVKVVGEGHRIESTLDRSRLWCAQTPQTFHYATLHAAHAELRGRKAAPTDDGALVEDAGGRVVVVPGSYENIKVTTPLDLALAEAIIRRRDLEI